jgi:hypothetical protein
MQRLKVLLPSLLLLFVIISGCADRTVKVYMANVPTYTSMEAWRQQPISFAGPRALETPGKIYLYNDLLLVNELMQGVHIYDNSNPSNPINLGFLPVHANQDMAVRNNILYVDSYTDLLSFDISDPHHPHFLSRVNDVFLFENPHLLPGYDLNYPVVTLDPSQGVITGWSLEETTEDVSNNLFRGGPANEDMLFTTFGGTQNNPVGSGVGGSLARFALWDHYLYALENSWELGVFDIQEGMVHVREIGLTRSAETLFPTDGNLYIGTTTGMLIYSLNNPGSPSFLSDYAHVTSCDPVVVDGDKAFVTLSTGRTCFGNVNVLQVIDLSDITHPILLYEFAMTNPRGLGVAGNTLFLCDGPDGLKVYDKTDLSMINFNMISQFSGITAADVIPYNDVLVMTSAEGIYQYSFANVQNISQLSLIPVQH